MKNPGTAATETGAIQRKSSDQLRPKRSTPSTSEAMRKLATADQKAAARMLGYALVLDDGNTWDAAATVFAARLTERERAAISWAGLVSCDTPLRERVLDYFRAPQPVCHQPRMRAHGETPEMTSAIAQAAEEYRRARDRRAA